MPATTYAYDAADQLTSVSGALSLTYDYDADGNRIAAGSDTFAYDWRDRLVEATVDSVTTTYDYAGDDLRVERTEGSTTTPFRWDRTGGLPVLVGAADTDVVQGPAGMLEEVGTGTVYPLRDGLGSLRARTDGTGTVVGTADWDAWGNPRAASGVEGDLGWTGELADPATGMTYLRARDYSPGTGRFTSRDAVQPNGPGTQGYNPYAYALNNPATLTDPSGHQATTAGVLRSDVTWSEAAKAFAITIAGAFTAEGTLTLLNMIGFSAGSALAIVAVYLLSFVGLILLINATIQWCRANDTCASVAGSVWAWIRYLVDGAWSKVETGVGQAGAAVGSFASRYASTAGCAGANGPHGEFGAPPPPEQCNPPCEEAQAEGGSKTSSTEGTAGVEITLSPNPGWERLVGEDGRLMLDAARDKVRELDAFARSGQAHVVKSPKRNPKESAAFRANCGNPHPTCDVDHIVDLQLGGQDAQSNMQFLDPLVNSSLGKKIERQLRCYDAGTIVTRVHWVGDPTGETW